MNLTEIGRDRLIEMIAEKDKRIAELESCLVIAGWFCKGCKVFNGEEKELLLFCRSCSEVKR